MPHTLARLSVLWTTITASVMASMLALPLVHIHPEATHNHGDGEHHHTSAIHPFFTGDVMLASAAGHDRHDHLPEPPDHANALRFPLDAATAAETSLCFDLGLSQRHVAQFAHVVVLPCGDARAFVDRAGIPASTPRLSPFLLRDRSSGIASRAPPTLPG